MPWLRAASHEQEEANVNVTCVVGARPNFVKIAPIMAELAKRGADRRLVHTGQHYDFEMSASFFADLDLPKPDADLGIGSGTHAVQTGTAMMGLEKEFQQNTPDVVVVVGDVNSTLAAALAAVKLHIKVAHVEAGYRSGDFSMPEEVNRLVVDQISQLLLAPTPDAVENLAKEGVVGEHVVFVGNVMAETLLRNLHKVKARANYAELGLTAGEYALATIHRAENTDDECRLRAICEGFHYSSVPIVWPLHPRTKKKLEEFKLIEDLATRVKLTEPMAYLDLLNVMANARLVLTDSGGVQEESCMLGVPCLTLRDNTERRLTVDVGANRLVPIDRREIIAAIERIKNGKYPAWSAPEKWDIEVSSRIVDALALL
ncbi:MAG: UDP-N-acetylglucosamine 2-epimerase (non-hydrolyzing) [Actinobacteria bacterium]|nr:MAG: UDP-N-acetylglucosamine 2-epimerase (non-hydrolyzing) [Actinomycetota bacterium]